MERIVLFDGVCNFCNGAVNFIIRHDRDKKFKFAALQSDVGMDLLAKFNIPSDVDSIVLVENHAPFIHSSSGVSVAVGSAFLHSTAALKIARTLGGLGKLFYVFIVLPESIRDWFYKLFAKYRYRLFGKKDVCMVPTAEIKERFL